MNARLDDYAEAVMGPGYLARQALMMQQGVAATLPADLYELDGLAARIVDLPADDATARGVTIEGDDDERIAAEYDRLNILAVLSDGARWARLLGGAALVLVVDDGRTLSEPLNETGLKQIAEIAVFDITQISSSGQPTYNDATKPNYGLPQSYMVTLTGRNAQFRVHESRLIGIGGDPRSPSQRHNLRLPWQGRSALAGCSADLRRYREGLRLSVEMLDRKQQPVFGMTGMGEVLGDAGPEAMTLVQQRVDMVDTARGLRNTVAIDAEDSYEMRDLNLSGVEKQIDEYKTALASSSGFPVTVLFGQSSTGLNATGSGDLEGYYKLVSRVQSRQIRPALERLTALIVKQKDYLAAGAAPEEWRVSFNPLWEPTVKEQAEANANDALADLRRAQTRQTDLNTGTVSEPEMRAYLAEEGLYGLDPAKVTAEEVIPPRDEDVKPNDKGKPNGREET